MLVCGCNDTKPPTLRAGHYSGTQTCDCLGGQEGSEQMRRPTTALNFQLLQQPPLEGKQKKGARLAWDCISCPSSPRRLKFSSSIKQPLWELQQGMEPNPARPGPPPHLTD
mmetsp:Transcript_140278/g.198810  ORF Transcript_140278/g.198810 Transcript_140278/m.198810 type:complete len:111 (+) Transcript_140278:247-579(+)